MKIIVKRISKKQYIFLKYYQGNILNDQSLKLGDQSLKMDDQNLKKYYQGIMKYYQGNMKNDQSLKVNNGPAAFTFLPFSK